MRAIKEQDIIGRRYGHLVVLALDSCRAGHKYFLCQCDCGKQKAISMSHLRTGSSHSCGCGVVESTIRRNTTHNDSKTRLYRIWSEMKRRCLKPSSAAYRYYGGRGIKLSADWLDYTSFQEWSLSHGYTDSLTIERIDVNGDYCPENCKWITKEEQARNKTNNRRITINGETRLVTDWLKDASVSSTQVYYRLKHGWSIEDALFLPDRRKLKRSVR